MTSMVDPCEAADHARLVEEVLRYIAENLNMRSSRWLTMKNFDCFMLNFLSFTQIQNSTSLTKRNNSTETATLQQQNEKLFASLSYFSIRIRLCSPGQTLHIKICIMLMFDCWLTVSHCVSNMWENRRKHIYIGQKKVSYKNKK